MSTLETQSAEFDAAIEFAKALEAHNCVPVVDDDYPEVRRHYESALARFIKAMRENGRDLSPPASGTVIEDVVEEIRKAVVKFPTWPTRIIDAGNVVSEEAGELAKACLQVVYEPEKENLSGVRMEAIQTAAMAIRFLVSLDRYSVEPGEQHEQGFDAIGINR